MEKLAQGVPVPIEFEYEILRKDGQTRTLFASTFHVLSGGKRMIQTTFQDITERKQAEEALRQAEEKYRAIVENAVEGIFQSTPDGKFLDDQYRRGQISRL